MRQLSQNIHNLLVVILLIAASTCALQRAKADPVAAKEELPRIPPTLPEAALDTFQLKKGFRIEQVAAEPLVCDPIAIAFDHRSRMYVVEMRGYSERRDEKLGRIRLLTDTDGDGRYDTSEVFADGLMWPTGVICWKTGIFVLESPNLLFLDDTDGNGVSDHKRVIFTGFASGKDRLNVQALPNSLTWGPDNRIHGATAMNGGRVGNPDGSNSISLDGRDFSFDPILLDLRAENGGGQYGMTFDSVGRKFVCSNSNHVQHIVYPARFSGLPPARVSIASDGPAAEVFRISPDEPWRLVRTRWRTKGQIGGPVEGGGRPSGYFTAATGITAYRGSALGAEFSDNLFVCDAGSNLVHRKIVTSSTNDASFLQATRPIAEATTEFLASSDNWFRPVQATNGPDDALYIVDMYREVIEHPWSLPPGIKENLDLNSGYDRGRIYRIVPEGFQPPQTLHFDRLGNAALAEKLNTASGWVRDTVNRILIERQASEAIPQLLAVFKNSPIPAARAAALNLLHSLGALDSSTLVAALMDSAPTVKLHAICLCSSHDDPTVRWALKGLCADPETEIAFLAGLQIGDVAGPSKRENVDTLLSLIQRPNCHPWLFTAAIRGLKKSPDATLESILSSPDFNDSPHLARILQSVSKDAVQSPSVTQRLTQVFL